MEFPNIGSRCSAKDCRQLDFLPITCSYCSNIFCNEHFHVMSHSCLKFINNIATRTETSATFCCSQESCLERSPIEILCSKCNKHFCLPHRNHDCFEKSKETRIKELEKWKKPKRDFLEAKAAIDQEITSKLQNSRNSVMANKLQFMRLKGHSIGPDHISTTERCYFLVHPPIKIFNSSKGVFVSIHWSIGKVIDSMADLLQISNYNNVTNLTKLRLYHHLTGNIVTNKMDVTLSELLNTKILVNGQTIILEYSNDDKIDCFLYK